MWGRKWKRLRITRWSGLGVLRGVYEGATKNTYGCPLKITSLRLHQTGVIIKEK